MSDNDVCVPKYDCLIYVCMCTKVWLFNPCVSEWVTIMGVYDYFQPIAWAWMQGIVWQCLSICHIGEGVGVDGREVVTLGQGSRWVVTRTDDNEPSHILATTQCCIYGSLQHCSMSIHKCTCFMVLSTWSNSRSFWSLFTIIYTSILLISKEI